tara:strand:- start:7056 stop:7370 length:315 start_codon:yes stop_codon:yes gene_type:complete
MDDINIDRAQLKALGQSDFLFMKAPSFDEAREKAVGRGMSKVRASCCLGTGWGFLGHDTNGLAVVIEVFKDSITTTTANPSSIAQVWEQIKRKEYERKTIRLYE